MIENKVVLYNKSRFRSFQFTMYHRIVCQAAGECFCGKRPAMGADQRGEYVQAERSVFLPPRGHSEPLPKEVLLVPQVKQALAELPPFIQIANELADVKVILPPAVPAAPEARPLPPAAPAPVTPAAAPAVSTFDSKLPVSRRRR